MKHLVQSDGSYFAEHNHRDQVWPPHKPDIKICAFFSDRNILYNALAEKASDE